jgi:hypothetical protein
MPTLTGAFKIVAAHYRVTNLHKRISSSKKVGNHNNHFKCTHTNNKNIEGVTKR